MEKLSKKFLDTFNKDMIIKIIKRNQSHPFDNASPLRINSIKKIIITILNHLTL